MMRSCWYFFLFISTSIFSNEYDLVKAQGILPYDGHNWFCNSNQLNLIFKTNFIANVVEVGSWLGGSTKFFANHVRGKGAVYAVDTWDGPNHRMIPEEINAYQEQSERLAKCYKQFLSNMIHTKNEDIVIPIRKSSREASQMEIFVEKTVAPDLIYIDAAHDTESVLQDLNAWFPYVKGHGILCGDDWCWPTVRKAVEMFAAENHLKIFAEGNFYRLIE